MICLTGPVFDYKGCVVASVGITTLTMFHTHESMLEAYTDPILATCRRISRTLGYVDPAGSHATPPAPFRMPFSGASRRAQHKEHTS